MIFTHMLFTKSHYSGFCPIYAEQNGEVCFCIRYLVYDICGIKAFFRYKVFSFRTFLCHRFASVLWTSLIP